MGKSLDTESGQSSATWETGGNLEEGLFAEERCRRGVCRSGLGLAEKIQVDLIEETGKGDVKHCTPSLARCG